MPIHLKRWRATITAVSETLIHFHVYCLWNLRDTLIIITRPQARRYATVIVRRKTFRGCPPTPLRLAAKHLDRCFADRLALPISSLIN